MKPYVGQLQALTLLRFLIVLFFLVVVEQGVLGVNWSANVPFGGWFGGFFFLLLILLTAFYLFWLRVGRNLAWFARLQCALDPLLIAGLIVATGGVKSPFFFLFGVAILNTAFLLGQREALLMAGMILICSVGVVTLLPFLGAVPFVPGMAEINKLVFQGVAFLLTALLAGALARRIGGIRRELNQQSDGLAGLTSLHYQVVQALPFGVIFTDGQGIIQDANPSLGALVEKSEIHLHGRPLAELFPALDWALKWVDRDHVYLEFLQESRVLGANITSLIDRENRAMGHLLVVRDLTSFKALEQQLASQARLSLTGQMAAGVAHEIRNPLASILSAAQMFSEDTPRDRKLKGIILEEVARLKQLTTDFLVFSRPATPNRASIPLLTCLQELLPQIQADPRWGKARQVVVKVPSSVNICFDPHQLRQIVWNLLLNAAQAAPDGGEVTIAWQPGSSPTRRQIVIEDDGPGLSGEMLGKVLEPFYTTRSDGTGLGLAVVAQLVRLNGGDIHLQSEPGRGLRVLLTVAEGGENGSDSAV